MSKRSNRSKSRFTTIIAAILVLIYVLLPSPADKPDKNDSVPPFDNTSITDTDKQNENISIDEHGYYYSKEDVAAYLCQYGKLPDNYIKKSEAYDLGWDSDEGNLWKVANGMVIGGDTFGNREGLLPKTSGVKYYECDVNYNGGYRGAERIIYSSDGNIYYTDDHYESFEHIGTFEVKK